MAAKYMMKSMPNISVAKKNMKKKEFFPYYGCHNHIFIDVNDYLFNESSTTPIHSLPVKE